MSGKNHLSLAEALAWRLPSACLSCVIRAGHLYDENWMEKGQSWVRGTMPSNVPGGLTLGMVQTLSLGQGT